LLLSAGIFIIQTGAMKVDILNGKGESVSKLPGDRRRLLVELKVIWHGRILQLPDIFNITLRFVGAFHVCLAHLSQLFTMCNMIL